MNRRSFLKGLLVAIPALKARIPIFPSGRKSYINPELNPLYIGGCYQEFPSYGDVIMVKMFGRIVETSDAFDVALSWDDGQDVPERKEIPSGTV